MRPKFAIYVAAGLTLCAAALTAALGMINVIADGLDVASQARGDAVLDLRYPDQGYQRIGIALLLVATQLVVIVYARKLNGEKQGAQAA